MINKFNEIQRVLAGAKSVLLVGHPKADGDCLGAFAAMADYLIHLGKKCAVAVSEEVPADFDFLPHLEKFFVAEGGFRKDNYDVILALDASNLERAGLTEFLEEEEGPVIINIDHHITNDGEGDVCLIKNVSSTCEIIYDFFRHINYDFDSKVATALLTGILTDTGMFAFINASSLTVKKAGELVARGANYNLITKRMFLSRQLPDLKLLGRLLNRIYFNEKTKILSLVLTKNDLAEEANTSSLASFLQQAKEPEIVMVLKENENGEIKVSLRSKRVDVASFAKKLGGGGHKLAAGFSVDGSLVERENGGWRIE